MSEQILADTGFSVTVPRTFYTIEGVQYRDVPVTVDFLAGFLDNGARRTQDEWTEFGDDGFVVPDGTLVTAIIGSLYDNRSNKEFSQVIGQIRDFFEQSFRKHYPATSSRVLYNPSGLDEVVHNYGRSDSFSVEASLQGHNGNLNADMGEATQALLGESPERVSEIYKWVTGKNSYLWRLVDVSAPTDRALVLGGSFGIDADYDFRPAFGVRVREAAPHEISTGN